ncbi:hypothetical protein INR49_030477 [Caranx melampygus]|nr:hypothetical protein INR49_030477 [Caranx melampygus]
MFIKLSFFPFLRPLQMFVTPVASAARRVLAAASHSSHEGKAKTWRTLSFVLAIPGVSVCWLNAYMKGQAHSHKQPEFVPYPHLRLRTKASLRSNLQTCRLKGVSSIKFPWGDGNHSLFHNPHTNPLPNGYESSHH